MAVGGGWSARPSAAGRGRWLSGAARGIDPRTGRTIVVRTGISAGGDRRRHKAVCKLASGGRWKSEIGPSFARTPFHLGRERRGPLHRDAAVPGASSHRGSWAALAGPKAPPDGTRGGPRHHEFGGRTKHVRMIMHAGIRALVQRTRTPPLQTKTDSRFNGRCHESAFRRGRMPNYNGERFGG